MKRLIRKTWDCNNGNHRGDFEHCPYCNEEYSIKKWIKQAVILVTNIVMGKHGYLAIVSECPKCFEKSWVHQCFLYGYCGGWNKSWVKASNEERNRREMKALRDWKKGLCGECERLESGTVTTTTRAHCGGRSGGVEFECDKFKKIK